ncbi:MAG: hypothetical protein WC050_00985, partial [Candidatus Paceibacterota bacterium]
MTAHLRHIPLICAFVIAMLFGFVAIAHAGTVTYAAWLVFDVPDWEQSVAVTHSVSYEAHAESAAGTNACGGSVPAGSEVRFKFKEHAVEDINWFFIGGPYDSPYGRWDTGLLTSQPPLISGTYGTYDGGSGFNMDIGNRTGNFAAARNPGTRGYYNSGWHDYNTMMTLLMKPPAKSISGVDGVFSCGAPDASGSVLCTANRPGNVTAAFQFAGTYGAYLSPDLPDNARQYYQTYVDNWNTSRTYMIQNYNYDPGPPSSFTDWFYPQLMGIAIPAQTISCPITVTTPANRPPSRPDEPTPGGACVVGKDFSIAMTSTDPDNDPLYYKVYWLWDSDPNAYERVPATGTAPSGQLQVAVHQYASAGAHVVKVQAVDTGGNTSPLSSALSAACTPAPALPSATIYPDSPSIIVGQSTGIHATFLAGTGDALSANNIDSPLGTGLGATTNPDATKSITFTPTTPGLYTFYARATTNYFNLWATYATTQVNVTAPSCTASYTCSGQTVIYTDDQCAVSTVVSCPAPSFCSAGSSSCLSPPLHFNPGGLLKINPSIVREDETTHLHWSVLNVAHCSLIGTNGDSWPDLVGNVGNGWMVSSGPDGYPTSRIQQRTTYTLTCTGVDGTATSSSATVN